MTQAIDQMRELADRHVMPLEGDRAFPPGHRRGLRQRGADRDGAGLLGFAQGPDLHAPGRLLRDRAFVARRHRRARGRPRRDRRRDADGAAPRCTSTWTRPTSDSARAGAAQSPPDPASTFSPFHSSQRRQTDEQQTHRPQDLAACAIAAGALGASGIAKAQTKLKWAHVYETSEPFHKYSVWAAEEIKKRTNGKYDIQVFPASSLGKEADINQGLTLGTVDIILHRRELRGAQLPAAGGHLLPVHLPRCRAPAEVREERRVQGAGQGLRRQDRQPHHRAQLLRRAPRDLERGEAGAQAGRHEGPEDPRARRAGLPGVPEGAGRQRHADRLRRGLPRAAERHRRRAGEPAADDRGQEVLRGAEEHLADRPHRRLAAHDASRASLEASCRPTTRRSSPT